MKTKYVPVRMDEPMQEALEDMREKLGLRSRSEVVRRAVNDFLSSTRPMIRQGLLDEFKQTRREFTNAGNNINQVAYKLNAGHPISSEEIRSAQEELQRTFGQMVRFYERVENELRR